MKHIFWCTCFLLITIDSYSQRVTFNKGGISTKNYYQAISYEFAEGRIYLTPEINGIKRKFLFDTGAPTQITTELFKELKPEVINKTEISDAAGNKTSLPIISVKRIQLDSLIFNDVPALVSAGDLYSCLHIDGVIGSNLLRNSVVQIQHAKKLIIITDDDTKLVIDRKNQTALIAGEPQSYPFFMIQVSGKKSLKVGFDTGSYNFLRLSEKDAWQMQKSDDLQMLSAGYGAGYRSLLGLQAPDSLYRFTMPFLTINGSAFDHIIAETSKSNNSRIGARLLDYGTVTLDFIHHSFYFEPIKNRNEMDEKLWPLKPVIDHNQLVVGIVWERLKGLVKFGERIISIDGESCESIDLCDWLNGRSELVMRNSTAILKIKDENGNIKEIRINKE